MWLLGSLGLIVFLVVVNPLRRRLREDELTKQLEKTRDPRLASLLADAAIAETRRDEAQARGWRQVYRFWSRGWFW
jgi:hypothetical protein